MTTDSTKSGMHKSKMAVYKGKGKVVPVPYFIPQHDFSTDIQFAELCEPLNFREIEVAKRYSYGNISGPLALHDVSPQLLELSTRTSFVRMSKKPGFKELSTYLKRLAFDYKFTGDLDDDTLLTILQECIHSMEPGIAKFNMAHKLLVIRAKRKSKPANEEPDISDLQGENKWEQTLSQIDKLGEIPDDAD